MLSKFSVKVTAAICVGLGMLVTLGVVGFRSIDESYLSGREVRRMLAVEQRLESIRLGITRAEEIQLRYQLTGNRADLDEFERLTGIVRGEIRDLDVVLVVGDQKERLHGLEDEVSARFEVLAKAMQARNGETTAGRTGNAAQQIAQLSEEISLREREMMRDQGEQAEANALLASRIIFWSAALAVLMLIWVIFVVNRYERERRRTEGELLGARERLGLALDASRSAVWDWDVAHDRMYLSEGWGAMLGGEAHETTTSSAQLFALIHPEDQETVRQRVRESLKSTSGDYRAEHRVRRADGAWIWIFSRGKVIARDAGGMPQRMAGINQDITEKKRIELALEEHDHRLRLALETAAMVGWDWDVASDAFTWEDSPERLLGAAPRGGYLTLQDTIHPEDLVGFIAALTRTAQTGEALKVEVRLLRSDGRLVWALARGRAEFDAAGKVKRVLGVVQDISEIKETEQALRESERELRLVTDSVPALISYVDASEQVRFCNSTLAALLGAKPAELIGRPLRQLFGEEVYRVLGPYARRALAGEKVRFQRPQTSRSGEVLDLDVTYIPKWGPVGQVEGFYSLSSDVTELRRLDRMKSEFVSTVSHELRTPLTSIRGSLGVLAGGVAGPLPDKARTFIDIAKNNCERLIRLINDILDMEKLESEKMVFHLRVLDLGEVLEQAVRANEGFAAQHNVQLRMVSTEAGAKVSADPDRLAQVFANLISNACKFSPAGASVDISIASEGSRVRVSVADRGPGVSAEFRKRIFQQFSQADSSDMRQKGGTGLGLSISRAIVERLGGEIGFESEPGKGATFYFVLPQWREPLAAPLAARTGRASVLVCEDEPDVAKLLQLMVQKAGYDSDLAGSAAQARALLRERRYAAMTLDLRLPDEDGLALLRELRADRSVQQIPVIVVSAAAQEGKLKVSGEYLGVVDWLDKPIDEERLLAALRSNAGSGALIRLLHVEDDTDVRNIVAAVVRDTATYSAAATLAEAKACLEQAPFDLVLLDLDLPDGSGWELLPIVNRLSPRPRVVIFTAQDADEASASFASAFLVKSQTSEQQLMIAIENAIGAPA